MIGKVWDAINDPIVGVLTDKTKSRYWGRRLPWMFYGAIPFGIFFFLQWTIPQFYLDPGQNALALFWYYIAIGILSQAFFTIVNLPYTAMTPELTQDYDERTSLNSFRFSFSIGGSILSLIFAQVVFSLVKSPQAQYLVLAALCTVLAVISLYWCIYGTRERILAFEAKRIQIEQPVEIPFIDQIRIAFTNKPFLFIKVLL